VRGVPSHPGPHRRVGAVGSLTRSAWVPDRSGPCTSVLLLRHGQTSLSAAKRYSGVTDVPLTSTGLRQAAAAAARLAGTVDVVVTSPLVRAVQTASAVAVMCPGAPVIEEPGFRETDFGSWEGCTFAEVQQRFPDDLTAWLGSPSVAPPGGESFVAVAARVLAALGSVLSSYPGRRVLVVSHVTPVKALVASALEAPLLAMYRMHLDLAALTGIDYYADGPAVLRCFNDTAHLSTVT